MIDLTRLRYFKAVAEAGSFSRAARRLGLSQPTLSIQVARLEEEIGQALLERTRSGVRLTPAGRTLLTGSADVFARLAEIETELRGTVVNPAGDLRIASVQSLAIYVLPQVLAAFTHQYERVRLSIQVDQSDNVLDMLESGEAEVAFTAQADQPPAEYNERLGEDPVLLVCAPGHRLWGRQFVRPTDLRGENLLALSGDSPTAQLVSKVLDEHTVSMHPLIQTPCLAALVRMVQMNIGLAFLPGLAVSDEVKSGRLHAITFAREELHRSLYASWATPERSAAADAFTTMVRQTIHGTGLR